MDVDETIFMLLSRDRTFRPNGFPTPSLRTLTNRATSYVFICATRSKRRWVRKPVQLLQERF
jgi:hypothetical protein